MRLPNRLALLCMLTGLVGTGPLFSWQEQKPVSAAPQQPATATQSNPLPAGVDANDPALPVWARPAVESQTPIQPVDATAPPPVPPPAPSTVGVVTRNDKGFVFSTRTDEVTLQATVVDQKLHLVTNLNASEFVVYEDDKPQKITSFRREDIPVSIGIVVDNSGSMRLKRAAVTKAVLNLIQASNPQDEVFIVNFNDEPYLDQDFTNDLDLMREALEHIDGRGGTALYDAVIAAADQLAKGGRREKKALLVVTDGEDTASHNSLEQAIRAVQNDKGPVIYSIGILDEEGKKRQARRALKALSDETGGSSFFPKTLDEVDEISQEVARDIRNQYSLAYKPTIPQSAGGYRRVRVEARGKGLKGLQVRTRSGYFAGEAVKPEPTKSAKPH